jgi:tetratricopeptide (TPR) repeat protein
MRPIASLACLFLLPAALSAQDAPPDLAALQQTANTAYMHGDYEAARQSYVKAWELAQQTPNNDPVRYDILKRLTSVRLAAGEFADADNYLQMAVNWRETVLGQSDPKIPDDLLISVGLCRAMKDYDRARAILGRVMGLHTVMYGGQSTAVADDFSRMAHIYMEQKNLQSAIGSYNSALTMRGKLVSQLDPTLVPDLDHIANAYIATRAYDKAEEAYRHALVIRETLYGKEDPDLIASVDGLAYSMLGQKKYDDAEPVYQRLIALWTRSVGEDHPMVAMALDKVATFYTLQKKFDLARDSQEKANAIRAHFLATGLSVAATEQTAEGHRDVALALYHRAINVLDPPSPVFADLLKDITEIVKSTETQGKAQKRTIPALPPRKN